MCISFGIDCSLRNENTWTLKPLLHSAFFPSILARNNTYDDTPWCHMTYIKRFSQKSIRNTDTDRTDFIPSTADVGGNNWNWNAQCVKILLEIYQSCLSAFLLLQAKVDGPSFHANTFCLPHLVLMDITELAWHFWNCIIHPDIAQLTYILVLRNTQHCATYLDIMQHRNTAHWHNKP